MSEWQPIETAPDEDDDYTSDGYLLNPTHWMPLPETPIIKFNFNFEPNCEISFDK